ncbi:MAG TPA: Gfo/Idh/MocA family oxidoreductase [Candidatus Acidoferrales bacterium]|nr:Gfo/Idh/MocA family oxidoreductase [Candidatus Acidoferrales bacterium]
MPRKRHSNEIQITRNRSRKQSKIRYAVVGLGYISQIAVLPAFAHAKENSELTALVSSDPEKLKKLARKYCVAATYSYEQFDQCLKSGEIDAVYIALPNNMHRAYTEAAADAGIHVLCEKPMAFNEDDCEAMISACDTAQVKLMIAYRLHFECGNLEAVKTVNSGKIGAPRIFSSVFSQQVKPGNTRLKKEIGGGAIYDMGIYCINAARYLFKAEPYEVFAYNQTGKDKDDRFREVPEMTSVLMRFPEERIAQFTTSFGAADRSAYEIVGTNGVLQMDPAYELAEALKAKVTVEGNAGTKTFDKRDQFAPELVYFSDCITNNKTPEPSGQEGLADVRIIRAILDSAASARPVRVQQTHINSRPTTKLEISKPPIVSPPQLINAAPPGAD